MTFELVWSEDAQETFERLQADAERALAGRKKNKRTKTSKPEGLFKQVYKCISLLADNPRHPGLNTHEYHSLNHPYEKAGKVFEAYVQNRTPGAYRVFWCYGPDKKQMTVLAITPHP